MDDMNMNDMEITMPGDACPHDNVYWSPVETEYASDGTAYVWQEGTCSDCHELVQVDYTMGEPEVIVSDTLNRQQNLTKGV
jgi:formate-dependent nitrite reductase cytochrome c552 subunit